MRKIQIAVIAFFILSLVALGGFKIWSNLDKDETRPVIECPESSIKVSVKEGEKALLEGLTARDDVDGDLTDAIRISSISHFAEQGKRTVEYVVFDSSNNFATCTRTVQYTDYESPRIYLDAPLRVGLSELDMIDTTSFMRVEDVLDGDISNKIRLSFDNSVYIQEPGFYSVTAQVSNSAGDTVSLPLQMHIVDSGNSEENQKYYPTLSDYVLYVKVNEAINLKTYLTGVMRGTQQYEFADDQSSVLNITRDDISIASHVDFSTPGTYTVDYSYTSPSGATGVTKMVVVVEE